MKLLIKIEGKSYEVDVEVLDDSGMPAVRSAPAVQAAPAPVAAAAPAAAAPASRRPAAGGAGGDGKTVRAPIAGTVLAVKCKVGDDVGLNQVLLTLEAMKMETPISAPGAGKVKAVHIAAGTAVTAGQLLVEIE